MIYNDSQKKAVMHTTGHDGPCRTGVGENRSDYGADLPACNERHFRLSYSCRNIYACGGKRDEGAVFEGDGKDEYPGHLWNVHGVFYAILRHTYRMSGNNILSEEEKKRLMRELVNHYARDLEEEDLEENLAREISTVKNNQIPLEHYYSACMPQEKISRNL